MKAKENSQIMKEAYASLKGKWAHAIGVYILFILIYMLLNIPFVNLIGVWVTPPLLVGILVFYLNISRDKTARSNDLFSAFDSRYLTIIYAAFLASFLIVMHMFLLFIPGIIAALALSQVFFLIADDPKLTASDAIYKSVKIMNGYKWKLFKINLRLFGLAILCVFTLGIGFFWYYPYQCVVLAKFYDDIKNNPSFKNQEYIN